MNKTTQAYPFIAQYPNRTVESIIVDLLPFSIMSLQLNLIDIIMTE